MLSRKQWALVSIVITSAVGCHSDIRSADMNRTVPESCGQVTVGPKLAALSDHASWGMERVTFQTGQLACQIFTGQDAKITLEVLSSELRFEQHDEFPLPVFRTMADYRIACMVKTGAQMMPLTATGSARSGIDHKPAIRDAVSAALYNLADQVAIVVVDQTK